MPRSASSRATATSCGSGAGGWPADSRYTPSSRVLSMSHTTHLITVCLARLRRSGNPPPALHRDVRRGEAELPVQRAHPHVARVDLARELRHPGLVGRAEHRGEQELADLAAIRPGSDRQRAEVAVPLAG